MKKTFTSMAIIILIVLSGQANVITVNSEVGMTADYVNLQDAVISASDGDTIYVQPSSVGYGNISINKRLYLLGAGHNPGFSLYNSQLGVFNFSTGSTGSVIKGLNIWYISSDQYSVVNDVVISGCMIWAQNPISMGGNTVHNNWIFEGDVIVTQTNGINFSWLGANLIVRNCFLHNFGGGTLVSYTPAGTKFDHNILIITEATTVNSIISSASSNSVIRNNVIYVTGNNSFNPSAGCASCLWENNITFDPNIGLIDLPGDNQDNVDPMFVSIPVNGGYYSYANNYSLQEASVGNNAATDGTDIGVYGGIFNFSQTGFDAGMPRVEEFELQTSSAPQGGTITIHLKAKGSGNN